MAADSGKNRRAQIRLDEREVDAFLAEHKKVQVATVGKHGEPHLSTLFYAMVDGQLAYWTYTTSQKAVNLSRDPTMTCLVEDGDDYAQLRGAVLYGKARTSAEPETVLRVGTEVGSRMTGIPVDELSTPEAQEGMRKSARRRVAVFMAVERIVSWDHSKL